MSLGPFVLPISVVEEVVHAFPRCQTQNRFTREPCCVGSSYPFFAHTASAAQFVPLTFHLETGELPAQADTDTIEVLLNPRELSVAKSASWQEHHNTGVDNPILEFTSGQPHRLQVELFCDTFDEGTDVSLLTAQIEALAAADPPKCLVVWGEALKFKSVLEHATTTFTAFLDDGTPVRAVMNTTWKEFSPPQEQ